MREILDRLIARDGVRAAAVFDAQGACLAVGGDTDLSNLGAAVGMMMSDSTSPFAARSNAIIVRFARSTLVVRRTRNATLLVMGDADLEMSPGGGAFAVSTALQVIGLRIGLGSRRAPRISESRETARGDVPEGLDASLAALRMQTPLPKLG